MGDGFYFVDIIIFAMIAAFLVYRLRSVLGRRHGEERQRPNPFSAAPPARPGSDAADNVVPLPNRGEPAAPAVPQPAPGEPLSLAMALEQLHAADPSFDEKPFVQGARVAFEMIVGAYALGDTPTLRPLLSDDVYDRFATAIRDRTAAGDSHETRIDRITDADLIECRLDGRTAYCTVRFVSQQMNVTRNHQGEVVDGDPARAVEVTDIWTFARNIQSPNPNWTLVETRIPH